MKRKLSLLKPYLHTIILKNKVMEKVKYLNIPTSVDLKTLKRDIKYGANQFSELEELISKENEPKYILISTDNLEQGYMAVTYLAAAFNRKHGMEIDSEWDSNLEKKEADKEEWVENELQIPVIEENNLRESMGSENNPFALGGMFMQGNQAGLRHTPYWVECVSCSVCIVCDSVNIGYGAFSFESQDISLHDGLNHFKENDKVYIIVKEHKECWEDGILTQFPDRERGKWNNIVLSLAADEASVKLDDEGAKKYYGLLFQAVFAKKNIRPQKGFSYERLVNMIATMQENNKCLLVENVVNYAVKDWKLLDGQTISNKDFSFIDRFCRTEEGCRNSDKKEKRSAMERMMQELIGMDDVKRQVCNIVNVMKYNKIRENMQIKGGKYHNVHLMLGAPGTAKTTVAQLMGQIMVEEHLLPDNRFTCINGAELKGMYVGHSAPKTKVLFEENDIIVIDEAYSLVGDYGENDSFSKEALAQLIIEIEKHSTDKLVIFAGYGGKKVSEKNNKMKDFLDANPGIKSRITSTIYFDSYSADEMANIFMRIAKNQSYKVDESARQIIVEHFKKRINDDNFGNGREARSLLETAVVFAANRVMKQSDKKYTRTDMQTILYEDVVSAILQVESGQEFQSAECRKNIIGF